MRSPLAAYCCRDLADVSGSERSQSIACCGHEARSRITALAFQPDGHLLVRLAFNALFFCQLELALLGLRL